MPLVLTSTPYWFGRPVVTRTRTCTCADRTSNMRRHTAATSPRRANITRPRKMARPGQIRSGPVRTLQAAAASGRDMGQQTAARTRFYAMIIDEVFMGGRSAQERLAAALSGVPVVWVGVQCDPGVAEARERARLDRVPGMARRQAGGVHGGVVYDLVVGSAAANAADGA